MAPEPPQSRSPRMSIFRETGLFEEHERNNRSALESDLHVRFKGEDSSARKQRKSRETVWEDAPEAADSQETTPDLSDSRKTIVSHTIAIPPKKSSFLHRAAIFTFLVAVSLPLAQRSSWLDRS